MDRYFGQKIALVFAYLCYLLAVASGIGVVFYEGERGKDPIEASLIASVLFFISVGIVLHVIASSRLKGPFPEQGEGPDEANDRRD
jgi:uncharacterized membrane protein